MTHRLLLLAAMMTGLFCSSCSDADSIDTYIGFQIGKKQLDQHLQNEVDRLNIAGMSIAFINEGQVVHYQNFGYANVEEKLPVTEQTIFEAASLSKPLFAYFVMKYVEAGKLDLDQPLYTYLPYPDIADDERYQQITARMVLSHRSGFPNWRSDYPENKLFIQFDPGTDYFYSGEGYQYLAMVLKAIDQTDWAGLESRFQAEVAQPLGLEHTVFIQNAYSKAHKAEPYDENGQWINPERDIDSSFRYQFRAPASVHSEALDFSKWLIALMNHEGLDKASFAELFRAHSYVGAFNSIDVDYSLGFFKPRTPLTNLYLHGGNNYGFTSYFAFDPDKKWGLVLFTNSEYGEQLGNELTLNMLTGPDLTKLYVIVGVIAVMILLMLFLGFRWVIRKLRS